MIAPQTPAPRSPGLFLAGIAIAVYPAATLAVDHAGNALLFLAVLASIASLVRRRRALGGLADVWDRDARLFALAMAAPLAAIGLTEVANGHFAADTLDAPTRFVLAVPVFLALRPHAARLTAWVGTSLALGAAAAGLVALFTPGFDGRATSAFLNAIHFGDMALVLAALSALSIGWLAAENPAAHALKAVAALLGMYASLASQSRGGWIALPAIAWLAAYAALSRRTATVRVLVSVVLPLLVVLLLALLPVVQHRWADLLADLDAYARGNTDTSVGTRLQLWETAWQLFCAHPWFGLGAHGFRDAMPGLEAQGVLTPYVAAFGRGEAHQQVLAYAADYGTPGVLALLALYFVPAFLLWRAALRASGPARRAGVLGAAFCVSFFFFGLSVETFDLKVTAAFYATICAVLAAQALPVRPAATGSATPVTDPGPPPCSAS